MDTKELIAFGHGGFAYVFDIVHGEFTFGGKKMMQVT